MERLADLHVHTTASDGALTPAQVVEAAMNAGLAAVGITDHDTVDGIDESLEAGKRLGIEAVPGVEISAVERGVEVHVLGYFIDHHHPDLLQQLVTVKEARLERGRLMVEKLNAMGVPVEFSRVLELARGGSVGRPHVARAICEVGAASGMDAAFGRYLVTGAPAFVPRYEISPQDAMTLIIRASGVPCLAHVAKLRHDEVVVALMDVGLAAIEIYHPDHGPTSERFYRKFAAKHGLIATGGSDAHCFPDGRSPGVGGVTVDYEVVEQLRALRVRL